MALKPKRWHCPSAKETSGFCPVTGLTDRLAVSTWVFGRQVLCWVTWKWNYWARVKVARVKVCVQL